MCDALRPLRFELRSSAAELCDVSSDRSLGVRSVLCRSPQLLPDLLQRASLRLWNTQQEKYEGQHPKPAVEPESALTADRGYEREKERGDQEIRRPVTD